MNQQTWAKKDKGQEQLYGFYARRRDTRQWVLIENRKGVNDDNVLDEFISSWRRIPKSERQKYDLMNLQHVNSIRDTAVHSLQDQVEELVIDDPLHVPRKDRLEVFGNDIIKDYQSGYVLLDLREKYHIGVTKIRNHLVKNGIPIRSKGVSPKNK